MNKTEKTFESPVIGETPRARFFRGAMELEKREHTLHALIKLHNRIEAEFDKKFIFVKGGEDCEEYLNIAAGLLKALRIVTEEIESINFIEEEKTNNGANLKRNGIDVGYRAFLGRDDYGR